MTVIDHLYTARAMIGEAPDFESDIEKQLDLKTCAETMSQVMRDLSPQSTRLIKNLESGETEIVLPKGLLCATTLIADGRDVTAYRRAPGDIKTTE